jgi:hypothetical protein
VGLGVKPCASGRDGIGVARGPSHSRARVAGRMLRAAAGRKSDRSIFVVLVLTSVECWIVEEECESATQESRI